MALSPSGNRNAVGLRNQTDRIEDAGHGPLSWYERISARAATTREVELLRLPAGVPVQRILRTSTSPAGRVCEVNATSMSAELYEIGYPVERARPSD
ncbi:UTRA domain-containing protein [Kutzneria sp. NPDC052558]|uniref:UTRA domain-containing protein n=1 Tax=Kutzneria sp. NPDC052558 TaxID=3364121 RepID=UPI0037CB4AE3